MTYPNARVVSYDYNTGIDSSISRLSSMSDSGGNIESYSYLGLGTIVRKIRPGSVLTDVKAYGTSNGDAGDQYTGLDRFGRVVNQQWVTADTINGGTAGDTLGTTTDQFQYGYDQDSDVLYKSNIVAPSFSELYHANSSSSGDNATAYDPLGRLTAFRRGTLTSSGNNGTSLDTITTANLNSTSGVPNLNTWTLDALGNWTTSGPTGSQTRTFNAQNQIKTISGLTSPTYDHNGNMTTDQSGKTYVYDAWNRMVTVTGGSPGTEYYTYDADNRRPGLTVCSGSISNSYYSTGWQDLEDDISSGSNTTKDTFLWSESYIDDLVARDESLNGGTAVRVYAQQDANHDVTSLVSSSGTVLERFIYDPYGTATVLSSSWTTTTDSRNWVYRFQGGRYDPVSGLVNFRSRDLNTVTGTWMEQDNFRGYADGMNLYLFERSASTEALDPYGTSATHAVWGPIADEIGWIEKVGDWSDEPLLNSVTNSPPPQSFIDENGQITLGAWAAQEDYRDILQVKVWLDVRCDNTIAAAHASATQKVGYTPGIGLYVQGQGQLSDKGIWGPDYKSYTYIAFARFRVSAIENFGYAALHLFVHGRLAWVWSKIVYTIDYTGQTNIRFSGSYVPSHSDYINYQQVGGYSMANNINGVDSFLAAEYDTLGPGVDESGQDFP